MRYFIPKNENWYTESGRALALQNVISLKEEELRELKKSYGKATLSMPKSRVVKQENNNDAKAV